MKKVGFKLVLVFVAILMLASCSQTPTPALSAAPTAEVTTATPAATPTPAPTATPKASPTPTATPVAAPTVNLTPDLPDPAAWKASLSLDVKDYPRVGGSTATLPLAIYMRSKITGASLADSTNATAFTTTGPAWVALTEKATDLLVVYEAPDVVKKELGSKMNDLTVKSIGLDALVFLANSGNPVSTLTQQQIIDIYTGKITNWKQVGGEDTSIVPYQRIANSGSQALMVKLVMKNTKMMDAPASLQPSEMGELINDIASYDNTKNALGYSVYYYVQNMYKVPGVKVLDVGGVKPGSDTIASGQYPYVNPFYAVIRKNEPADSPARKLFDWLTGAEGKKAVADAGYVAEK